MQIPMELNEVHYNELLMLKEEKTIDDGARQNV